MLHLFHCLVHQPDQQSQGWRCQLFCYITAQWKTGQVSDNNWIAPEVLIEYFKSSFRCPQRKGTHRKPRRRTRVCRCNQSKRGPCHCGKSVQPQKLWNISAVPGMSSGLPVYFLVSVFVYFVFSFYPFLPLITAVMKNCILVSSSPKECLIFLLSSPPLLF